MQIIALGFEIANPFPPILKEQFSVDKKTKSAVSFYQVMRCSVESFLLTLVLLQTNYLNL